MNHPLSKLSLGIIFIAFLVRLLGIIEYPLHDPTEARYAEIPRLIIETGHWIMPPFSYDQPFWGKPPLTFWLTAISFQLFGYSEFAARLPVLLLAGLLLWMLYQFAKTVQSTEKALFSTLVLLSTALFFIASGAVMTDMALCVCITLSMISFWQALHQESAHQVNKWGYLFFVGLGVGLLVKGPIVGVLVLLPLFAWVVVEKQWITVWQKIPWLIGSGLMLLIALPWYLLAEMDSPGFLNYFLVGEHFKRFVDAGWHGDLYGVAHQHPRGKIWLLWLFASFPWSFIFLASALTWRFRKNQQITLKSVTKNHFWYNYLLFWAIMPMVFFNFSGNILYTYVLPGLPGFALLLTELLSLRFDTQSILNSRWLYATLIIPCVGIVFLSIFWFAPEKLDFEKNQKYLVEVYQHDKLSTQSTLSYVGERLYSIEFYTQGKAKHIVLNAPTLVKLGSNTVEDYLIIPKYSVSKQLLNAFKIVQTYRKYALLKER